MNTKLRYLGLLAVLPLFTMVLTTDYVMEVDALKSRGSDAPGRVGASSFGPATKNIVCGDRLCSEYPGGRAGFEARKAPIEEEKEETMEEKMMEDTMKITEEAMEEKMIDESMLGSVLRLSRANVPATIPLHQGYYNGEPVYFIITDSSDPKHAEIITQNQGWNVELAPLLANAPKEALSTTYMFTNGVDGDGVHGFQGEVLTSTPAQPDVYSALASHVHVTWNKDTTSVLTSEEEILAAADADDVTLSELEVVLNMPQIVWPDGQMMVKEDKTLTDETPYGGGQVLDINTDDMTVTFIAHRGW